MGYVNVHAAINSNGCTPLHEACFMGNFWIVEYLVETCGVNLEAETKQGERAIYFASCGHTMAPRKPAKADLDSVLDYYGHFKIVRYLIDKGINIEAQCRNRLTALHRACYNDNLDMVQYLVELGGANVQAASRAGVTPLHFACRNRNHYMVQYLLKKGDAATMVVAADCNGETAFHEALRYNCSQWSALRVLLTLVEHLPA